MLDKQGPHAGDLPNSHVPATGEIAFELFLAECR
jgi:Cu/Zn superoxide dismutase